MDNRPHPYDVGVTPGKQASRTAFGLAGQVSDEDRLRALFDAYRMRPAR